MSLDMTAAGRSRPARRRGPGRSCPARGHGPGWHAAGAAAAILACVMAAGCGSGRPAQTSPAQHRAPTAASPRAGGGSPATSTPASTPLADGPASPASPAAPASASPGPGVTASPASPARPPSPCAPSAVLMEITSAAHRADGSLELSGHRARAVGCGGPEYSFGYTLAAAPATAHAAPGVRITVIPLPMGSPATRVLPAARFPGYLATGQDTRIFVVSGPLTGVTALYEMYHP